MGYKPRGLAQAKEILEKSSSFVVYYDPDIDGLVSGYMVQRFLSMYGFSSLYYINADRQHGFKMCKEQLQSLVGHTIICVDFSVSREELQMIVDFGVNVIVIDHHQIDLPELLEVRSSVTGCMAVVINNQYGFEPAEYNFLSGAGVVYYTLCSISKEFDDDDMRTLVGISLLSDSRAIENDIAGGFLSTTYSHKSPMVDYLLDVTKPLRDYGFGVQSTLDRNYIDFTLSPKLNAMFRFNKNDDAVKLIHGGVGGDNDLNFLRGVQTKIVDEILTGLDGVELSNLIVKWVDKDLQTCYETNIANFIGLVCSRVRGIGKTACVFVRDGGRVVKGSVRGLHDGVDYLSIFKSFGLQCAGHKSAFGILESDSFSVNLEGLNREIGLQEDKIVKDNTSRIIEVSNMSIFAQSPKCVKVARHNNFVRDFNRIGLKYTGSNIKREVKGKMWEYILDGVSVKAFAEYITPETDIILPLQERGNYTTFYMKRV